MFARKHIHIAGGKAATQIATAAGKGVALVSRPLSLKSFRLI